VHPKTGKVCVPIDPEQASLFNPETVPTVHHLLHQLQQGAADSLKDSRKVGCLSHSFGSRHGIGRTATAMDGSVGGC